jgi:hypothetical protein
MTFAYHSTVLVMHVQYVMACTVSATLLSPGGWTARTPAPPTPHSAGRTRYMIILYS